MGAPENPPAFPHNFEAFRDSKGMTLRDYFAAQVVSQNISLAVNQDGSWDPDNAAYHAYLVADAMLAARTTPPADREEA